MFFRMWANIIMLIALAWGAHNVVAGHHFIEGTWQYYFCLVCPWALLYGSLKAWHRCFTWRRMMAEKDISPFLSRGKYHPSRLRKRPSILEHACFYLFIVSVLAIMEQLRIENAAWWVGSFLGSYFLLRLAIRIAR